MGKLNIRAGDYLVGGVFLLGVGISAVTNYEKFTTPVNSTTPIKVQNSDITELRGITPSKLEVACKDGNEEEPCEVTLTYDGKSCSLTYNGTILICLPK